MATVNSGGMPGRPKAEFLRSVRDALGRVEGPPEHPYHRLEEELDTLEERATELETRLRENRPQLLDRFVEMAAKGGWNVHRVSGAEAAVGQVDSIIGELGATRIVRSGQPVFDDLPVDTALDWRGIELVPVVRDSLTTREELREKMRHADVGLTGTDYALAETGSLVIMPRQGLSRLVSLVPPVHVALVRPEEVLESLHDLFLLRRLEYKRRGGEMGSYLNFITGPSRTADIEMTIVQGVHGPRAVHMILVE
ncbi:Lactate utilization protein C [Geodia barretti]|uniref:Lactate utilization protein C n=1 Tax=Geodia barretti TaxID=519541 RepID=A0AA35RVL8_GEOBA|nr:Lactate utilization protein C [Geodia barretti]